MQQCGTACPNICGEVPLTAPVGRRQLAEGGTPAATGPTCSSMQRGMVIQIER